ANAARAATPPPAPGVPVSLWAALLGALFGGVILNLMPCVFPVLAIKVLAFARHAGDKTAHRANGLAYTAGVVLSFLALGGLLLGLRAAGEQLGWGFQLQSPGVVAALAVLFTLIGLNLAGLFEFGNVLPSRVASLQAKNPTADAFLTGVLATAIASPCTAPFMGASLGLAIGLPTLQALAVFGALGLGMALPYLAASWWPAIARALPRPGAWMATFRQLMAFPMFATVVWLLWVLGQQSGIDGAAALLMLLVVLALLVWALGLRGKGRTVLAALSLAGLLWLGWAVGPNVTRLQDASPGAEVATAVQGVSWQPWSPERQATLLAEGRPVFVDFTAAWCVTCQYNKRSTLADTEVLADMAARNVALLRADWTRRDPLVTQALASLGRNGVPVYAIYQNGQPPRVLTEVLTVNEVRTAIKGL
ncbi:protein-disulfide reductase DsbD family protein, partial [Hydrogenophaga sp.]